MKKYLIIFTLYLLFPAVLLAKGPVTKFSDLIYNPGELKPIDSQLKVKVGDTAPDFTLPSLSGRDIRLSDYRGKKGVVLSFIPAAWTPVCSGQWPGYNIVQEIFAQSDAVLLGISVDNIPSLFAWTEEMGGMKFGILSDFWPHGETAQKYGVLRSDGTAERALFFIGKDGVIRGILLSDINVRPPLEEVLNALEKIAS